jgi:hypothetical protein
MKRLSREQLVQLIERIRDCRACEQDLDSMLCLLEENLPGNAASQLIFAPADGKERTAEEIIDAAGRTRVDQSEGD